LRLLLDSHILLWWADGGEKLGARGRKLVESDENDLIVSAATWWEVSIKKAHGRLNVDLEALEPALAVRRVARIDISFAHAQAAANLPPIHGDPFDRMLIAQAQVEGVQLLTRDKQLKPYGATVFCV
jgi:PIN domain nuclease of toxin-antitoxin system